MKYLTPEEMLEVLRRACKEAGSQKAWANAKGFDPSLISEILRGRRDVTEKVANALGFGKGVVFYEMDDRQDKTK